MAKGGLVFLSDDGLSEFRPAAQSPFALHDPNGNAPGDMRHVALQSDDDGLRVYYTRVGDCPEAILRARVVPDGPDMQTWRASEFEQVLAPELDWEGADLPLRASAVRRVQRPGECPPRSGNPRRGRAHLPSLFGRGRIRNSDRGAARRDVSLETARMQRVYLLHHMKRSGGHAVIYWLAKNFPKAVFVNNEIPVQPILEGRRSVPDGKMRYEDWVRKKARKPEYANVLADASTVLVSLEDHELCVRPFSHPAIESIVIVRRPQICSRAASRNRATRTCCHTVSTTRNFSAVPCASGRSMRAPLSDRRTPGRQYTASSTMRGSPEPTTARRWRENSDLASSANHREN